MSKARVIITVSICTILAGCTGLHKVPVKPDQISVCPKQNAGTLVTEQNQLSPRSGSHALQCALTVLRDSQDPVVRRNSLGSRLCLYLAERETVQEKREKLAGDGVEFAESALALGGGEDGAVHYYLAANLGLVVREHIALAMSNLGRLEREMKRAVDLSPEIDEGGPLRLLGALYMKAPPWPSGIGDLDKALALLEKAANKYPAHPLNHLFYAQALWNEGDEAALSQAKAEFTLGEKLLTEGSWGYSEVPWKLEFDNFRQELGEFVSGQ